MLRFVKAKEDDEEYEVVTLAIKKRFAWLLRKVDSWRFRKPILGYFETHLVDHCNMNCRRCAHFSCLAEPSFADIESFKKDLSRLCELFANVRVIRLMGGEPLLHGQVVGFMRAAREAFPKARIHLVSNGLLADRMEKEFWESCHALDVIFQVTVYPPLGEWRLERIRAICRAEKVRLELSFTDEFAAWLNRDGDSPLAETFKECRKAIYCPLLKEGRLFTCATAAFVGFFNKRFGSHYPVDTGIDLYETGLTGRDVLKRLEQPIPFCRYCARVKEPKPWSNGCPEADDWFVGQGTKSVGP